MAVRGALPADLGMTRRWAFKHFGWPGPEGLAVLTPHRIVDSRALRAAPGALVELAPTDRRQRRDRAVTATRFDVINVHLSPHDDGEHAAREAAIVLDAARRLDPAAGHRRRLQRRSGRSRSGRSRRRRVDRRLDARPSRRRRRIDELDGGRATRPTADPAARLRVRPAGWRVIDAAVLATADRYDWFAERSDHLPRRRHRRPPESPVR